MIRLFTVLALMSAPAMACAEVELSFYGGSQSAPHSLVTVTGDPLIADEEFTAGWDGLSFTAPPQYGIRATWWQDSNYGFGVELNHAKVYADDATRAANGYDVLEFTDGLNILTVNGFRRWQDAFAGLTPYVGGGIGISVPHVEVTKNGSDTFGYQLGGPAVAWMAGATYPINDRWSVFGEYKGTYSMNSVDLDSGGTLETNIITNSINIGVGLNF
jgi:lipid A oxidase